MTAQRLRRATLMVTIVCGTLHLTQAHRLIQDEAIRLKAELVVLDAQVLRKKTALPINNLARENFILYEDGVKQPITHFSRDKLPLSVIILVDVSGSVIPDMKAAGRLLRGAYEAMKLLKREDEVALMQFAAKSTLVQPFTRDHDLAVTSLARLDGRGQNGTSVDEGILGAVDYMRSASNPDSRRAIIALTDDLTIRLVRGDSAASSTHAEGEALHKLYESGSVLCTLLYESDETYGDSRVVRGIAKHFSEATGGIVIKTSHEDIPSRLAELIDRLRQRYTIGYSSSNTASDGKFRKIRLMVTPEVEKREGGVAVITRKGYYAK